jgi:hypothetical protein
VINFTMLLVTRTSIEPQKFVNLDVRDFDFSCSLILVILFRIFVTAFVESGLDRVPGESIPAIAMITLRSVSICLL